MISLMRKAAGVSLALYAFGPMSDEHGHGDTYDLAFVASLKLNRYRYSRKIAAGAPLVAKGLRAAPPAPLAFRAAPPSAMTQGSKDTPSLAPSPPKLSHQLEEQAALQATASGPPSPLTEKLKATASGPPPAIHKPDSTKPVAVYSGLSQSFDTMYNSIPEPDKITPYIDNARITIHRESDVSVGIYVTCCAWKVGEIEENSITTVYTKTKLTKDEGPNPTLREAHEATKPNQVSPAEAVNLGERAKNALIGEMVSDMIAKAIHDDLFFSQG
jgi:hypothetical protein